MTIRSLVSTSPRASCFLFANLKSCFDLCSFFPLISSHHFLLTTEILQNSSVARLTHLGGIPQRGTLFLYPASENTIHVLTSKLDRSRYVYVFILLLIITLGPVLLVQCHPAALSMFDLRISWPKTSCFLL